MVTKNIKRQYFLRIFEIFWIKFNLKTRRYKNMDTKFYENTTFFRSILDCWKNILKKTTWLNFSAIDIKYEKKPFLYYSPQNSIAIYNIIYFNFRVLLRYNCSKIVPFLILQFHKGPKNLLKNIEQVNVYMKLHIIFFDKFI